MPAPVSEIAYVWRITADPMPSTASTSGGSRRTTGRQLQRLVVASLLDIPPREVIVGSFCPWCGGVDHGVPTIASPRGSGLSLSYAGAGSVHVIALGTSAVGVDVERDDRVAELDLSRISRVLPAWDAVAARCGAGARGVEIWTAMEAVTKGMGRGLAATRAEVDEALDSWTFQWTHTGGLTMCTATTLEAEVRFTTSHLGDRWWTSQSSHSLVETAHLSG